MKDLLEHLLCKEIRLARTALGHLRARGGLTPEVRAAGQRIVDAHERMERDKFSIAAMCDARTEICTATDLLVEHWRSMQPRFIC